MLKYVFTGLIYYISFLFAKQYTTGFAIYAVLLFYLGILIYLGALNFLGRFAESNFLHSRKEYAIKPEVYLYLLFSASLLAIQPIAWTYFPWLKENVDMPTFMFVLLLMAIWLLKLRFIEIAKISLIVLGLIPIMLLNQYNSVAEMFAIITYLLWGVLILEMLFQQNQS